ncbi:hypothetical protein BU23DRAFT_602154 [Bimuria novae-zelandiae CBS 107.79]|uniref:Uncharacterized protein n=1 Tax=Bimuria novae-zelandiae CBS 107.79 TaxID=1447943 RepID=A0A6A5UX75_9PLEO|nr:hypothetical protein BU23DRAFT_602154 [Bimuria novae-zelandiae CBS 107.79]
MIADRKKGILTQELSEANCEKIALAELKAENATREAAAANSQMQHLARKLADHSLHLDLLDEGTFQALREVVKVIHSNTDIRFSLNNNLTNDLIKMAELYSSLDSEYCSVEKWSTYVHATSREAVMPLSCAGTVSIGFGSKRSRKRRCALWWS